MEQNLQNSVYVMSCIWELFVVVGKNARGDRRVIRCAVDLAKVRPYRAQMNYNVDHDYRKYRPKRPLQDRIPLPFMS